MTEINLAMDQLVVAASNISQGMTDALATMTPGQQSVLLAMVNGGRRVRMAELAASLKRAEGDVRRLKREIAAMATEHPLQGGHDDA